jgi:membrane protein
VKWEHALSGGVFTAIGLEVAQRGLGAYLTKASVYASVYGAFAALPIFLIWIYLSWLMILLGAVVAAYAPVLMSQLKRWPDEPGYQFQMALAVIRQLQTAQHQPQAGYTALALARNLRTDTLQLEPVLETLLQLDWIALLDEPDAQEGARLVLLCDTDHTLVAPLAGQLLLRPDPSASAFWTQARLNDMSLTDALGSAGAI